MNLKSFILAVLPLYILLGFSSETDSIKWETNLEEALSRARKENKTTLLYFCGSDWCSPCKNLEKDVFESEKFAAYNGELILVKCDIPRKLDVISKEQLSYNKGLLSEYNSDKKFPKLMAFSKKGRLLDEISAYSPQSNGKFHFKFLDKILKR